MDSPFRGSEKYGWKCLGKYHMLYTIARQIKKTCTQRPRCAHKATKRTYSTMSFLLGMHQNEIVWTEMCPTPTKPKFQLSFGLPAFPSHKNVSLLLLRLRFLWCNIFTPGIYPVVRRDLVLALVPPVWFGAWCPEARTVSAPFLLSFWSFTGLLLASISQYLHLSVWFLFPQHYRKLPHLWSMISRPKVSGNEQSREQSSANGLRSWGVNTLAPLPLGCHNLKVHVLHWIPESPEWD